MSRGKYSRNKLTSLTITKFQGFLVFFFFAVLSFLANILVWDWLLLIQDNQINQSLSH